MGIEIITNDGKDWWWHVTGGNGEVLCHSQQYTDKEAAFKGISATSREFEKNEPIKVFNRAKEGKEV